ncbi:restriction endonuclease subunit S [Weissella viridescens]|uniref:restriction endonuclease subunit S n=1 Tax=Weissella viridescens TaxID=1629 RepID=UPI003AF1FB69
MPEFKEFRVGELFEINTGSLLKADDLTSGNVPRISVKSTDNGVLGWYDTKGNDQARHFENFISVNFFGNAFYHSSFCSVEMKVHVLQIKGYQFNRETGLYLASVLNKYFSGRYGYGNQLSSSMLKKNSFFISLPVTLDGIPDWQYMADYVKKIEADYVKKIDAYLQVLGYPDVESVKLTDADREVLERHANAEFAEFEIGSLFDVIKRGKRIKSADRINGNLPFVTAGEGKMGISAYIGNTEAERFSSNSLTIDMFGTTRYRGYIFGADDHVTVLNSSNNEFPKQVLQYMQPNIEKAIAGKFSYSKNFYASDAPHIKISLPIEHNLINLKLMEDYIKVIEKKTVTKLVKTLNDKLLAFKQVTS